MKKKHDDKRAPGKNTLKLQREVLRTLTPEDTAAVHGGGQSTAWSSIVTTTTGTIIHYP